MYEAKLADKFIVDLDDFCESNEDWLLLVHLRQFVPNIKFNLFTIPGECSENYIHRMREYDWLRLYPHGYVHRTSRECEQWTYEVSNNYLAQLERNGWPKLWRSPGWMTSDELFQCLADRQWIVADQIYNNERRPKNLRAYLLDSPNKIHGHIGHWGGGHNDNSLEHIFEQIATLEGEFLFIEDLWNQ